MKMSWAEKKLFTIRRAYIWITNYTTIILKYDTKFRLAGSVAQTVIHKTAFICTGPWVYTICKHITLSRITMTICKQTWITLITGANVIIRAGRESSSPKSGSNPSFCPKHRRHILLKFNVMFNTLFTPANYI